MSIATPVESQAATVPRRASPSEVPVLDLGDWIAGGSPDELVRQLATSASFSTPPSVVSSTRLELMSIQNGQPLIVATRT